MATLLEISTITEDALWNPFLGKIRSATVIKAAAVIDSIAVGGVTWAAATSYTVNTWVNPVNGHLYKATIGGVSGGTEPIWPTDGTIIADGSVIWRDMGTDAIPVSVGMLEWAKEAVAEPNKAGEDIAFYIVAANAGLALTVIYNASDLAIQNNVNDAVDSIYGA